MSAWERGGGASGGFRMGAGGGALFLSGALIMFYNVLMTIRQGTAAAPAPAPPPAAAAAAVAGGQ